MARDFTPWLAANITKLGDALDMQLEVTAVEADVGDFSLDILSNVSSVLGLLEREQRAPMMSCDYKHINSL